MMDAVGERPAFDIDNALIGPLAIVDGNGTVSAGDEFQGEFTLADTALASEQHADPHDFHEHTMHGEPFGKPMREKVL